MSCRGCDANSTLLQEATAASSNFGQLTEFASPTMSNLQPCPTCTGPTSKSFLGKYKTDLDLFIANSTITSIDYLGDQIVQLEDCKCEEQVMEFFSDVFVDFIPAGSGTPNITDQESRILEEGLRTSYNTLNSLNNETCDVLFRAIDDVQLIVEPVTVNRRHFAQIEPNDAAHKPNSSVAVHPTLLRPLVYLFRVRGRCRGCARNAALFDQGTRRRSLIELHNTRSNERQLQGLKENPNTTDGCVCVVQPEEFRAPTREEFTTVYNDTVAALVDADGVKFKVEVAEVVEVEEVECPKKVTNFTTTIFFHITGLPGKMNSTEEALIVHSFVSVYNGIAKELCDPLFRTVTTATVVQLLDAAGTLIDDENPVSPDANVNYTVVFEARGRCRGCPPNSNLFDDGTLPGQRRLLLQGRRQLYGLSRRMEQESTCYCDKEVAEEGTPSETEFSGEFRDEIFSRGLRSVANVLEIEEPNPTASPTITASAPISPPFPSSTPTSSAFAYEVASPAPSASTKETPSSSPSSPPSLKPSASPAPTGTPMPTSPSFSTIALTVAKSSMPSRATPTPAPTPIPIDPQKPTLSPKLMPSSTPSGQSAPSANPSDGSYSPSKLTPSDLPSGAPSVEPSDLPSLSFVPSGQASDSASGVQTALTSEASSYPFAAPSESSDVPSDAPSYISKPVPSLDSSPPSGYPSIDSNLPFLAQIFRMHPRAPLQILRPRPLLLLVKLGEGCLRILLRALPRVFRILPPALRPIFRIFRLLFQVVRLASTFPSFSPSSTNSPASILSNHPSRMEHGIENRTEHWKNPLEQSMESQLEHQMEQE